jgi:glutamine cyclotransferase
MKKYIIIGLLALAVLGLVIVPMIKSSDSSQIVEEKAPAIFLFDENLACTYDQIIPLAFEVNSEEVVKVEIVFNDSVFKTFNSPKGKLSMEFNASFYGVGTKTLSLLSTLKDGSQFTDNRLIIVLSDIKPEAWSVEILNTYKHDPQNFIQGLEFYKGKLYEGTGDPDRRGSTKVGVIDPKTGLFSNFIGLDANYFGEGITILNDKLYQLTYTQGKCFVYNVNDLSVEKEFIYQGEGWGICNDGEFLYTSDGTQRITKRNANTFEVIESIEVCTDKGSISNINELEFVDGLIYANVWTTNSLLVIQPETGKVIATINAAELAILGRKNADVLNGIAYSKTSNSFYLTGKYWDTMFEVKFNKLKNL